MQAVSRRTKLGMAERIQEDAGKFECPLCSRGFQSAKSTRWHLKEKHKGHPRQEEAYKSVPNDTCPYCGKGMTNLVSHKRTCGSRPLADAPQQQAPPANRVVRQRPPHRYEGLSNSDMMAKFQEWMTRRFKLDPRGAVQGLGKLLEHELDLDSSFRAFTWFIVGTSENRDPRWRRIRPFGEYRQKYMTNCVTVEKMNTAYLHLVSWIEDEVTQQLADPVSQLSAGGPSSPATGKSKFQFKTWLYRPSEAE